MLDLTGVNSYTGSTNVNGGTLQLDLSARSGAINPLQGPYTVASPATLVLTNSATATDNTLIQNTSFTGSGTMAKTGAGYLSLHSGSSIANFTGTINV